MVDVKKRIEEVRKFQVLYDQSSEKYSNFEYKEKVWKIIATNLEVEGKSKNFMCLKVFFIFDVNFNNI
jgi:hypothetical protein